METEPAAPASRQSAPPTPLPSDGARKPVDVDSRSSGSASPPLPPPSPSPPRSDPQHAGAGTDGKDPQGRQLRLPSAVQGIRYGNGLTCAADSFIELLYQLFLASPKFFGCPDLQSLKQVLEQRGRDQPGLMSTARPLCRDWFIGLLRSNFMMFNDSRDDKQNHIPEVPRLGGELNLLSLIGILFCPNTVDLKELVLKDNIESA
jgi:hypothetical protein